MPRLLVLLLAGIVWADPIETRWAIAVEPGVPSLELVLRDKPSENTTPANSVPPPRYARLELGAHRFTIAVNPQRLWIDRDRDGLFEGGEWTLGRARDGAVHYRFSLLLPLGHAGAMQPVPLLFSLEGDRLLAGHALERAGEVELLGRVRPFRLRDGNCDLRFHDPSHDLVYLDIDGDAELTRHERSKVLDTIAIGEAGFTCLPGDPSASVVEFPRATSRPSPRPRVLDRVPAPPTPRKAPGGGKARVESLLQQAAPGDIIDALGATGAGFDALAPIIRDRKRAPAQRARAVRALGYVEYVGHAEFFEKLATGRRPAAVRAAAVRAMYDAGLSGRELIYAQLLRDGENTEVFGAAARCLAWTNARMAGAALARVREPARRTALYAALRGAVPAETVLDCAKERYAPLRAMALRDLFLLGRREARSLALAAALEPKLAGEVTAVAVQILGASGSAEGVHVIFDLVARKVWPAEKVARELLRLERRESAVVAITGQLAAKSPEARKLAIELLGQIPTKPASDALAKHYGKEKEPALVRALHTALLAHAHPEIVRRLQRPIRRAEDIGDMQLEIDALVERGQRHAGVRAALIELMEWRNWEARVLVMRALKPGLYPDLARACAKNLRHRVWQVRLSAAEALARFRVRDGIEPLVAAMQKEDQGRVRKAMATTLQELTGEKLRDYPELWRKWWEREGASFEVAAQKPRPKKKKDTGETKTVATFYGIPITSNRVIFVLDRSGSMGQQDRTDPATRLDRAKVELQRAVKGMPKETKANVVFFGTGSFQWRSRMVPLNGTNRRQLDMYLTGVTPAGGTDMYDALAFALQDKEVETIYLLSDGHPTGRNARMQDMLREIGKLNRVKRVRIHTISLGYESPLLREMAKRNDGTYESR
ncbi:MAG: VWA domain-containing protein [Planctomycetota bacterium]